MSDREMEITDATVIGIECDGLGNVGILTRPHMPKNAVAILGADPKEEMRKRLADRRAEGSADQHNERQLDVVAELKTQPQTKHSPANQHGGRQLLTVDLETLPDHSREHLFDLEPLPEIVEAAPETPLEQCPVIADLIPLAIGKVEDHLSKINPPDSWLAELEQAEQSGKKRDGIFKAINESRLAKQINETSKAARQQALEARIKKMSVTPEMCCIAAMGYAIGDSEPVAMVVGVDGVTEEMILDKFWELARVHGPIVGFHVLGFDLPVIFIRSMLLGILPTKLLDLKPWGSDVIDLMAVRWPKSGAIKLKDLARMFGIEVPAGDIEGSQAYDLMKTSPETVGVYVKSDIVVTRQIHKFFRGFFCR